MQGNLGLAMIVMAAIFLGAAIYRKKFLNLIFDTIKKGNASLDGKFDTQKIVNTSKTMARRLGVTDVMTDWWFSRRRTGRTTQNTPPPGNNNPGNQSTTPPGNGYSNQDTPKLENKPLDPEVLDPERQEKSQADVQGYINKSTTWNTTCTVMDDDNPGEQRHKQLPEGGMKNKNSSQTSTGYKPTRQQGKQDNPETGTSLDTTGAIPPGVTNKNNNTDNPKS